jgi:two-component system, NtrC family, response regulator AtoC
LASVVLLGCGDASVAAELGKQGHSVRTAPLGAPGTDSVGSPPPDVVIASPNGIPAAGVARRLSLEAPASAVVIILAPAQAGDASIVLDAGATDVAVEPLTAASAAVLVTRAVREARARARIRYMQGREARGAELREVIGQSATMKRLFETLARLARRSSAGPAVRILFTGETGTGKNLLARVFHFNSNRRDEPFVEVNCGALPGTLVEAELFGYERGAFTDARTSHAGLFEAAHGGTLFLDEVTCLGMESQAKLLTALESGRVRRLGSSEDRVVDVQVVAATSLDIPTLVSKGQFRSELYHRLSAFSFGLPPLRDRGDDAVMLAEKFTEEISRSYGLPPKRLGDAAKAAIRSYRWPGNIRELYHAIERAVLGEERDVIEPTDLRLDLATAAKVQAGPNGKIDVDIPEAGLALEDVERAMIEKALRMAQGNVTRAAALLKVSRDTLRYRLEKFGINPATSG